MDSSIIAAVGAAVVILVALLVVDAMVCAGSGIGG
jgi:hypothetical protein